MCIILCIIILHSTFFPYKNPDSVPSLFIQEWLEYQGAQKLHRKMLKLIWMKRILVMQTVEHSYVCVQKDFCTSVHSLHRKIFSMLNVANRHRPLIYNSVTFLIGIDVECWIRPPFSCISAGIHIFHWSMAVRSRPHIFTSWLKNSWLRWFCLVCV